MVTDSKAYALQNIYLQTVISLAAISNVLEPNLTAKINPDAISVGCEHIVLFREEYFTLFYHRQLLATQRNLFLPIICINELLLYAQQR